MFERNLIFYIDYVCPYSWRLAELINNTKDELGFTVQSRHFSLYQHNYDPTKTGKAWEIWNDTVDPTDEYGSKGLLPFLAGHAARRLGPEMYETFRLELQRARHVYHLPFVPETVQNVLRSTDINALEFAAEIRNPELPLELAKEHQAATRLNIAGTPTISLESGQTAYLRLESIPDDISEQVSFLRGILDFMYAYPEVATLRRTKPLIN